MEGDPVDQLFIVKYGVVKIYRFDDENKIIPSLLRPSEFFGEMALIRSSLTRSPTAKPFRLAEDRGVKLGNGILVDIRLTYQIWNYAEKKDTPAPPSSRSSIRSRPGTA